MRERSSLPFSLFTLVGFATTVFLSGIAGAAPVVITFEEIPNAGAALSQYADKGVTFNQPRVRDYSLDDTLPPGFAHSGTKGIEHCFALEFCTTPIEAAFTAPQRDPAVGAECSRAPSSSRGRSTSRAARCGSAHS